MKDSKSRITKNVNKEEDFEVYDKSIEEEEDDE